MNADGPIITISTYWDDGELTTSEIRYEDRSIPYMVKQGIRIHRMASERIHRMASELCEEIGRWKIAQDKRNVSE